MAPPVEAGEPVNAATGNKYEAETDFSCDAHIGLGLTRYYNSQDTTKSAFGTGWHGTWQAGLSFNNSGGSSTVTVISQDGREDVFTENSSGQWIPAANVTSTLTPVLNGSELVAWNLTLANDTVETFLPNGQLSSITTRAGLVTTLAYNNAGDLTSVTGPFGHVMSFTYDAASPIHHVTGMTAPDGTLYAYAYDTNNNLVSVTYPDGTVRQYQYQNASFLNALTGIVDEDGNLYSSTSYDSQGRALTTQLANGADLTTFAYKSDGSTSITDADGNTHTLAFASEFGLMQVSGLTGAPAPEVGGSAFTYDSNGFLASKTDFDGNVTTYTHDARGDLLTDTGANGTTLQRTTSTTWLTTFHLPSLITEPNGRTTSFGYDAHGNLLAKTVAAGTETRSWHYTYNTAGQVLTAEDPDGNVTTYTYDTRGDVASVSDALGHKTLFTSYDNAGRLLSSTDPNGLVTQLAYDLRGRLISRNVGTEITSFTYDAAGNLIKVTKPDESFDVYVYDQAHRLTHVYDALNNQLAFALDGNGNRTGASAYDGGGTLRQTRGFAYDSVNRLMAEIGAQGQTTGYAHDPEGNLLSVSDPLDNVTHYAYDALNRRVLGTDPEGGNSLYAYDIVDRLISETDPRNLVTGYGYDGLDDQTSTSSPDAGNTTRTFDAAGNVLSSTDARGKTTHYSYDRLNRVTEALYADGSRSVYQYDQGTYGIGHLTAMEDPSGNTSYSYDQHGRVIEKQQETGNLRLVTRYAYDSAGRLSSITYPSGKAVSLTYDAAGQVNGLLDGRSSLIASVVYQPFGPAAAWRQGNGASLIRSFDLDGRITGIDGGGSTLSYGYDAASRITTFGDTGYPNQSFGYDSLDRLTGFTEGTQNTAYSYDADGNRLKLADTSPLLSSAYGIAATSNRLLTEATGTGTEAHNDAYTYDASGNLLEDTVTMTVNNHDDWFPGFWQPSNNPETEKHSLLWAYDARGRMASVTAEEELDDAHGHAFDNIERTTEYAINGLGERVAKFGQDRFGWLDSFNGATAYNYDEAGHLIGEYDERGNVIEEIVYLGDIPVALMEGNYFGGNGIYYVTADNLAAPHIVTDARGRKVWEWHHNPFGDTDPATAQGFDLDLRFPGQVHDRESGLNYNLMRDYNPKLGRYVQSDPIGLLAGVNTYGYVGQNPVTRVDRKALQWEPIVEEAGPFIEEEGPKLVEVIQNEIQQLDAYIQNYINEELSTTETATATIGEECPLVYGPSAGGQLSNLAQSMGGQILTQLNKPVELSWSEFSIQTLNSAAETGQSVIFELTNMQNLPGVLNGSSYPNAVTTMELLYLRSNWNVFSPIVQFVLNGQPVGPPW